MCATRLREGLCNFSGESGPGSTLMFGSLVCVATISFCSFSVRVSMLKLGFRLVTVVGMVMCIFMLLLFRV